MEKELDKNLKQSLHLMNDLGQPLSIMNLFNSAYLMQEKDQAFEKGNYKFEYHPLVFLKSPKLKLEIDELADRNYLKRGGYKENSKSSIKGGLKSEEESFFGKRYVDFLRNHFDKIGLISLNTFIRNNYNVENKEAITYKTSQLSGIEDKKFLEESFNSAEKLWEL